MKSSSQSSSHRKPVGGIRSVQLTAAKNIDYVEVDDADTLRYKRLVFLDPQQVMECSLLEDASAMEESISADGGTVAIRHSLELVALYNEAAAWLEPEFYREALDGGVCAVVELNDGRRLLVGYSERFETKQPLRMKEIRSLSGRAPIDAPTVMLTLEAYDTSAALIYAGN